MIIIDVDGMFPAVRRVGAGCRGMACSRAPRCSTQGYRRAPRCGGRNVTDLMYWMVRLSIATRRGTTSRSTQTPEEPLGFLAEGLPGRVARAGLGLVLAHS